MNETLQDTIDLREIRKQVERMYTALMGSDLTGDGGLIERVRELEKDGQWFRNELQEKQKQIDKINLSKQQTELYVKIIWGMVGAFVSGIFGYTLQLIFKH